MHVANGRQGSLEPNRSYLSHFTTWYSKSGHFAIENPIKNENWPLTPSYGSIILKIVLWAHFTNSHAVLRGSSDFFEKSVFWDRLMNTLPMLTQGVSLLMQCSVVLRRQSCWLSVPEKPWARSCAARWSCDGSSCHSIFPFSHFSFVGFIRFSICSRLRIPSSRIIPTVFMLSISVSDFLKGEFSKCDTE